METKSEILEELKQWHSPLAGAPRAMPFDVPENYFNSLQDSIITTVQAENKPLHWNDATPYNVPEAYFNSLPREVLAKAKQSENSMPKKRSITLPLFIKAAAAVLVLALGVAGYQYITTGEKTTSEQLSNVPSEDINSYLEQNKTEINTDLLAYDATGVDVGSLEEVDSETIVAYLDEDGWYVTKK